MEDHPTPRDRVALRSPWHDLGRFKVAREFLGLSGDWLAGHLGVSGRVVRHLEAGSTQSLTESLTESAWKSRPWNTAPAEFIAGVVEGLTDIPEPAVVTCRTDEEYHAAYPGIGFPAAWHRAVVARVALEVPGLSITYANAVLETRTR